METASREWPKRDKIGVSKLIFDCRQWEESRLINVQKQCFLCLYLWTNELEVV